MNNPNTLPSDRAPIVGVIDPDANTATPRRPPPTLQPDGGSFSPLTYVVKNCRLHNLVEREAEKTDTGQQRD